MTDQTPRAPRRRLGRDSIGYCDATSSNQAHSETTTTCCRPSTSAEATIGAIQVANVTTRSRLLRRNSGASSSSRSATSSSRRGRRRNKNHSASRHCPGRRPSTDSVSNQRKQFTVELYYDDAETASILHLPPPQIDEINEQLLEEDPGGLQQYFVGRFGSHRDLLGKLLSDTDFSEPSLREHSPPRQPTRRASLVDAVESWRPTRRASLIVDSTETTFHDSGISMDDWTVEEGDLPEYKNGVHDYESTEEARNMLDTKSINLHSPQLRRATLVLEDLDTNDDLVRGCPQVGLGLDDVQPLVHDNSRLLPTARGDKLYRCSLVLDEVLNASTVSDLTEDYRLPQHHPQDQDPPSNRKPPALPQRRAMLYLGEDAWDEVVATLGGMIDEDDDENSSIEDIVNVAGNSHYPDLELIENGEKSNENHLTDPLSRPPSIPVRRVTLMLNAEDINNLG